MLVTSIHAQSQDFLKWLILEMDTDGKCEKNIEIMFITW
jgi:hypothetical protein